MDGCQLMTPRQLLLALWFTFNIPCIVQAFVGRGSKVARTPSSSIQSTTTNTQSEEPLWSSSRGATQQPQVQQQVPQQPATQHHECTFCSQTFASRNALFRHIRSDCSGRNSTSLSSTLDWPQQPALVKQTLALQFAYVSHNNNSNNDDNKNAADDRPSEAQQAGTCLVQAFEEALQSMVRDSNEQTTTRVLAFTQATLANQRHVILAQEPGVAAARDVATVRFAAPDFLVEDRTRYLQDLLSRTCEALNRGQNQRENLKVCLMAGTWCEPGHFHAEQRCTQRIYHYLLPLRWLPEGNELERAWLEENQAVGGELGANIFHSHPDVWRKIHAAFKSAESVSVPNRRVRRREAAHANDNHNVGSLSARNKRNHPVRLAQGRYQALANKERRPFHNFANPKLRGDASPNQEPVWRCVDRCRITGLFATTTEGEDETHVEAVVEIRGDDFVQGQIRRVIGTAVAMAHEWLPPSFMETATRVDTFVETPVAPEGRLYLQEARFHGHDLWSNNSNSNNNTRISTNASQWIQQELLLQRSKKSHIREEEKWLENLRDSVAPRICQQLEEQNKARKEMADSALLRKDPPYQVPLVYNRTLRLLREIVASNSWPETSVARSSVIRRVNEGLGASKGGRAGSFTVVNPNYYRGEDSIEPERLPLANSLFPDLTCAVFELEKELSLDMASMDKASMDGTLLSNLSSCRPRRPTSSHCAVNCNAQFTPHVDSGRGAGQSLSMIVGLGDYTGGQLLVEGQSHGIKFKPLEFDGWKSRHWTNFYQGERFSLVFFTPEEKASC